MSSQRLPLAVWLLALAACLWIVHGTTVTTDMSAFLPGGASQAERAMIAQIKDGALSRTMIVAIEGAPLETLIALDRSLGHTLAADPAFAAVANGDAALHRADGAVLWKNRYLLSPGVTPDRFTEAGLHRALVADLAQLGSAAGMELAQAMPADPTQEMPTILQALQAGVEHPVIHDGIMVSPDGKRAMLIVETVAAGADLDGQAAAQAALQKAFAAARDSQQAAGTAKLVFSGPGIFAVEARRHMKRDITRISVIASGLVAALLLAAYRSPVQLAWSILPVASGVMAGMAAVAARFGFVHGITLGFGVTLIGEAVDYAVYYFATASDPARLARLWPVMTLGMAASLAGFGAMLFSSFPGFAQLGLFTMTGLAVALAVTRFVLPVVAPVTRPVAFAHLPGLPLSPRAGQIAVAALTLAALAGIALHKGGAWQQSLDSLNPVPAAGQALYHSLRQDAALPETTLALLVTAPAQQDVLQTLESLHPQLDALQAKGVLGDVSSPDILLPSIAAQAMRRAALPDAATLKARLQAAATGTPFKPELFASFLADAEVARRAPDITPATYLGTGLSQKIQTQLFPAGSDWNALIMLPDATDKTALQTLTVNSPASATVLDMAEFPRQLLSTYRHEALALAAAGSCAIGLLLLITLRSLNRTARVLLPLACAVIVTFAAMLAISGSLSIFHLFGLLLSVAVGSNYCLFLERSAAGEDRSRTLQSLILANLCTIIGFGVLSASSVPLLQGIGGTVAIGAGLSLLFGLALIQPKANA